MLHWGTDCTSGQQQQGIPVHRLSLSREEMVTSSQPVSPTQPPLKGHGFRFGGCPGLLSDLMVVISTATNPWNTNGQNVGSFSIPLQWWSLKTKHNGSWDHAGVCIVWLQTPLQQHHHQCLMLEVQWVTVFPHREYTVLGLWKTSQHVLVFHFNFNQVGGERTSQKRAKQRSPPTSIPQSLVKW